MKFKHLPQRPKPGVFLYCLQCLGEYSAVRADYQYPSPEDHVECCGSPCVLVQRKCRLISITANRAELPERTS